MEATLIRSDSRTLSGWRARPRSFVALMSLYESNHVRLGWLAGDLTARQGIYVSTVQGDCDLVLTITERTPYTTAMNLTYRLGADAERVPDMLLRVYHDARVAECMGFVAARSPLQRLLERELDQRWARNVMLNKWLEYCADRGHRFAAR